MTTPQIMASAQTVFAIALVFVLPLLDLPLAKRLKQRTSSAARLAWYRSVALILWCALAVALALNGPSTLFTVPDDAASLVADGWTYAMAAVIAVAYFVLALLPGVQSLLKPSVRAKYGKAMRRLRHVLPVSPIERRWWALVSVSAGVCEEFLFRGFLLTYLGGHLIGGPHLSLPMAWLLSSIAFGLGHLYQGAVGVAQTTVAGLIFGLVAILTGNLALPILLHCLADLQALVMYRPALDAPEDAAVLVAGCSDATGALGGAP